VSCDHLPGPALLEFELARRNISHPASVIDQLFENSRDSWRFLQSESGNRVLWREEGADRFRYSIVIAKKRVTSAIDVRRESPSVLRTHGHVYGPRRLDCAIHRYSVAAQAELGELGERVEIRSTSRIFRFYRRSMLRDAVKAANRQLDELMQVL
jgi:hypothetical protein